MTEEKHCEEHKRWEKDHLEIDNRCKNEKYDFIPLTPSQETDCKKEIKEVH